MMKAPLTAVILTFNEEQNLPSCLRSIEGWCPQIFVVDSGSTDRTADIAKNAGAQVVHHLFQTHAKQWAWALRELPIEQEWILALDADLRVSPELKEELLSALPTVPQETAGFFVPRKLIFRGRWIRHGGVWPKEMLKLFRRPAIQMDDQELVDHLFYVQGQTGRCRFCLIDENQNDRSITVWLQRQLRYVELQAQEELRFRRGQRSWKINPSPWGTPHQRVLWHRNVWYHLPPVWRSFLYFGYRYGIRLGFLDGRSGALFHFLQGFWLRLMIDVRLLELQKS